MKGSNALLFLFLIDAVAFIIIPKKDEVLFISACVLLVGYYIVRAIETKNK